MDPIVIAVFSAFIFEAFILGAWVALAFWQDIPQDDQIHTGRG